MDEQKKNMETLDRLADIQARLKAPKGQFNSFGGYKYRSAEDILEAVKPLLKEVGAVLTLSDEIVAVGDRIYVAATARFLSTNGSPEISVKAYAREEATKKGMDGAQITGSASSYARKSALNGLFAIDDTKDPDATNTHGKEQNPPPRPVAPQKAVDEVTKAKLAAWGLFKKSPMAKDLSQEDLKKRFREVAEETVGIPCQQFAASDWNDVSEKIKSASEE